MLMLKKVLAVAAVVVVMMGGGMVAAQMAQRWAVPTLQSTDQELALKNHFLRQIAGEFEEQFFLRNDFLLPFIRVHRLQFLELGGAESIQPGILQFALV